MKKTLIHQYLTAQFRQKFEVQISFFEFAKFLFNFIPGRKFSFSLLNAFEAFVEFFFLFCAECDFFFVYAIPDFFY